MLPLLTAIRQKTLPASVEIVFSHHKEALILKRAADLGFKTTWFSTANVSSPEIDKQLSTLLTSYSIDLIILVGYMRILSCSFVTTWQNKIINVHPSLLPLFAGQKDTIIHEQVLKNGFKETGCTVHWVTEAVDAGPILLQKRCPVYTVDSIETLKERVQDLEGKALIEAVNIISGVRNNHG